MFRVSLAYSAKIHRRPQLGHFCKVEFRLSGICEQRPGSVNNAMISAPFTPSFLTKPIEKIVRLLTIGAYQDGVGGASAEVVMGQFIARKGPLAALGPLRGVKCPVAL